MRTPSERNLSFFVKLKEYIQPLRKQKQVCFHKYCIFFLSCTTYKFFRKALCMFYFYGVIKSFFFVFVYHTGLLFFSFCKIFFLFKNYKVYLVTISILRTFFLKIEIHFMYCAFRKTFIKKVYRRCIMMH